MRLFSFLLLLLLAVPASADWHKPEAVLASGGMPVAFSQDGKTLFAASGETTELWETATWQMRASFPYRAKSFALARDGHVLAATSLDDGLVRVFDASTGEVRRRFKLGKRDFRAAALSSDGKVLALGSYETLWFFDVRSGRELLGSGWFKYPVDSLAFCLDGKLLAVGNQLGEIVLWDVSRAKEIGMLDGNQKRVYSLAYSADTATLASVGADDAITVWDLKARKQRLRIPVQVPRDAFFVAITRDAKRIASVSVEGVVKLWDTKDGNELATLPQHERGFSIAFSPDSKLLAVGFLRKVTVWKLANGNR
jgi:WD40 repeat protein